MSSTSLADGLASTLVCFDIDEATDLWPIKRLGIDTRQFLATALEIIDAQRRGETPPATTTLLPLFSEELLSSIPHERSGETVTSLHDVMPRERNVTSG